MRSDHGVRKVTTMENYQSPLVSSQADGLHPILLAARNLAELGKLKYSGDVSLQDAWYLFSHGMAKLVDVRTPKELQNVGEIPSSINLVWKPVEGGKDGGKDNAFLQHLRAIAKQETPLLFICCCGKRSVAAAEAATAAGFNSVFTVAEGFEGPHDECNQRGHGGWRHSGLPWVGS